MSYNTINLCFSSDDGSDVIFRMKDTQYMSTAMIAYAQRSALNPNALMFNAKGRIICPSDTPRMLKLKNNDHIRIEILS